VNDIDGKPVSLSQFRGKALLLVNTASFCDTTPQYTDLEKMDEQYREKGFDHHRTKPSAPDIIQDVERLLGGFTNQDYS